MDASGSTGLRATCEGCQATVEVEDIFSFDCACPGCGGLLLLDGEEAALIDDTELSSEDEAALAATDPAATSTGSTARLIRPGSDDRPRVDGTDEDERELFDGAAPASSLHDRPTRADTLDDPYELAAQALDSSVSRSTSRLATSRRTTQAVAAYTEEELLDGDGGGLAGPAERLTTSDGATKDHDASSDRLLAEDHGAATAPRSKPLLAGTPPDAPPVPSWDDTGKVVAGAPPQPGETIEGLVEVVEVPIGGTAGRGSRTYERDEVLGAAPGGDVGGGEPAAHAATPERAASGRLARPEQHDADGPLFGGEDLDWLALIDDNLPESELGDADGKPRVVIRLPEDAAPTDTADSDRVRQFEQAIKNLEAGGPGAIDGLLRGGPGDTSRTARRYDGSSTQPIPVDGESTRPVGSSTQPLKRPEEDTRSWDTTDDDTGKVTRPSSARNEAAKAGDVARPRGPRSVETFRHDDLDPALVCARDASSPQADRFRQLVQRIFHPTEGPAPRVVMVTSPRPGDGKTTVATNLAIAAAGRLPGRGAVLVDADPRGRGVLHLFGVRVRNEGLLEALRAEAPGAPDPRDFVLQFSLGTLDVVPLGIPGSDAAELLASERMVAFLGRLRDTYPGAAVIVDASPVLHAADPLVLARGVDGVVLVVRADHTPRDEVRRAMEMLGPRRVLGLVLNDSVA